MSSPTQRTLAWLREDGYRAEIVEKWIPQSRTRRDLFGCIDILAINDEETIGVQATGGWSNVSARLAKIRALDSARCWLAGGRRLQIVGWKKYTRAQDGKWWRPIVREVVIADLDVMSGGGDVEEP